MPRTPSVLAVLCLASLACGESGPDTGDAAVDIPLVASTEEVFTTGALAGEDWENFGVIAGTVFDSEGNLYVVDEGARRVVVIGPDGSHVRTVGTQGDGPGEFSSPTAAAPLDDGGLVVWDFSLPGAFEIFDGRGEFVRSVPVDLSRGGPGSMLLPLPDGRLVSAGGPTFRTGAPGEAPEGDGEEEDHRRPIDVFSLDGSPKTVLYRAWNLPPTEADDEVAGSDEQGRTTVEMRFSRMRAFDPGLHIGVLSDGHVVVADSTAYEVKLIGPDGTVTGSVSRAIAPEAVTEAIMEAERARRREAFSESEGGPRMRIVGPATSIAMDEGFQQQMREMMLAQVESMVFAQEIPVIAEMAVDRQDHIWIARAGAGGDGDGPTDILTPDGDYMGTLAADGLRIPDGFGPDGLMVYIESDEMDVQSVRVVRLLGLEPS
ncbi:MAG: hypothetical protein OXU74_05340 [Gemmatimonadota bacterium]|nr:hypothetical protein [Gemmatimonadota bacterium]